MVDDGTYRLIMRGLEKDVLVQHLMFKTREVPDMVSPLMKFRKTFNEIQSIRINLDKGVGCLTFDNIDTISYDI